MVLMVRYGIRLGYGTNHILWILEVDQMNLDTPLVRTHILESSTALGKLVRCVDG